MNPFNSNTFGNSLLLRVDGAVGAMSLSPNGRDAVLAGRRGLFIIDLEEPFTAPRWLHHITSWEVADVQWSPHHHAKPSWCISTSNQKALLWDLSRPSDTAILNVAHQHTRAITDINFHPADPELFATCSIDTFVLCWDARTPRKATHNWAEWRAGATQVKWNHHNPYEIASSHDHSFYLWDVRYGLLPVLRVATAHQGKINGMDFELGRLVTCSNDQTVKYWDLSGAKQTSNDNQPKNSDSSVSTASQYDGDQISPAIVIPTSFPVARARPVPFGSIPRCGVMPLRGGDDAIHIIDVNDHLKQYASTGETQEVPFDPAWSYKGHGGAMKDFLWRRRHENYAGVDESRPTKDYQLVTWSSVDKDLKLWEPQGPKEDSVPEPPIFAPTRSASTISSSSSIPVTVKATATPAPPYNYTSYCSEPPITLQNILSKTHGDILTAMTMHKLAQKHKNLPTLPSQLNHLAWISGVRMGDTTDSPSNLGEEVSFVAHTFPKVRFERISVSTGDLIISLRGPPRTAPRSGVIEESGEKDDPTETNATTSITTNNNATTASATNAASTTTATAQTSSITANSVTAQTVTTTATTTSTTSGTANNASTNNSAVPATPASAAGSTTAGIEGDADIEDELIFIRLKITFPKSYPYLEQGGKSAVKFAVEETHDLTANIKQEMERQLGEIAAFYVNRHQRFCLEPVVRYLIGDNVVLDDEQLKQVVEVGSEGWADDLVLALVNALAVPTVVLELELELELESDMSSEELGRDLTLSFDQFSDFMPALNDDELVHSTGLLQHDADANIEAIDTKARVDLTPLPKGCGALWSRTGQLVCFFIPKPLEDDEALQKFSIFKFSHADHGDLLSHGHHDNDDQSSVVLSQSLASTDSFEWEDLDEGPFRAGLFKTSVGLGNRYVQNGASTTQKLSVHERRKKTKGKNIVGIFDFSHLLPDKPALAREYRVLGDTPELLARYNGDVAERYREMEVAAAWRLLEMVLVKDIEVNEVSPVYLAAITQGQNDDNTDDDGEGRTESQGLGIRTRPSGHRGSRAVAGPKFNTSNDVSVGSIIANSAANGGKLSKPVLRNIQAMNHLRHINLTGQRLPTYRFYWGSHPFGYSWLVKEMIEYFRQRGNLQMVVMILCILYENMGNWAGVPIHTPYREQRSSVGDIYRQGRGSSSRGSIDRGIRYNGNGNYGSSYGSANSSVRVASAATSQHRMSTTRGASPVAAARGMSPAATSFGGNFTPALAPALSINVRPPPSVEVSFQNLDTLDIFEDIYTASLLSSQDEEQLKLYRHQYADMLYSWGLPANRIKILKFNYPNSVHSKYSQHECSYGFRLELYDDTQTYVNEAGTSDTARRPVGRFCNYCGLMVVKRVVVCTGCEHVMHSQCASEWWSDNGECASGCGCECMKEGVAMGRE